MFNKGDILVSVFGYDCQLVEFYKVVRATEKTCWIQQIDWKFVSDDGYGQAGEVIPNEERFGSSGAKTLAKRQPDKDSEYPCVKISSYQRAYKWNGKPVHYDSYD